MREGRTAASAVKMFAMTVMREAMSGNIWDLTLERLNLTELMSLLLHGCRDQYSAHHGTNPVSDSAT